uniref:Uncharacterized protein n=1 Tax=Picea sitchensis TaxID=3332 RepID=A9NTR3_PICSI|nr:unknown [Picea sitchensis]
MAKAVQSKSSCAMDSFASRSDHGFEEFVPSLPLHNLKASDELQLLGLGITISGYLTAIVLMGVVLST